MKAFARTPDWRQIEVEHRGLRIRSTRFLGEGWCSRAYLVNDELVFRYPKRAEQWEELDREIQFLAFAADTLPLAVPRVVHVAPHSPAAAHGYVVHHYLRGGPLDARALSDVKQAEAADRIAAFLRTLHGLRPTVPLADVLPRVDARLGAEDLLARAERDIVPRLEPAQTRVLRTEFERYLGTPGHFAFAPAVLHADFSSEHVLVEDGAIVAAIDFGDVTWGDPDYDFMYLFADAGEGFVENVARRYGHPDLEQLRAKLRFFALTDPIDTILDGHGYALEGQEDEAWQRLRQLLRPQDAGV